MSVYTPELLSIVSPSANEGAHQASLLEHQHLVVRAEVNNPPKDAEEMCEWIRNLVDKIEMKIMIGPIAEYSHIVGNRGLTAVAVIETSHIAVHAWDEVSPALLMVDVYSCSKLVPTHVIQHMDIFDVQKVEYKFLDRKNNLSIIEG